MQDQPTQQPNGELEENTDKKGVDREEAMLAEAFGRGTGAETSGDVGLDGSLDAVTEPTYDIEDDAPKGLRGLFRRIIKIINILVVICALGLLIWFSYNYF